MSNMKKKLEELDSSSVTTVDLIRITTYSLCLSVSLSSARSQEAAFEQPNPRYRKNARSRGKRKAKSRDSMADLLSPFLSPL